ncbi:MAG: radical SAM protein [bacterium]|nr:radical SAM protein [bacterium]
MTEKTKNEEIKWPKVTLVLPRSKVHRSSAISMAGAEHLGLGYIAAYLRGIGVKVTLLNFQLSAFFNAWDGLDDPRQSYDVEALAKEVLATSPDVVGFCATSMTLEDALAMALIIKRENPACIIGLGGPHSILCADEIFREFKAVDFIGLNDGERPIALLLEAIGRGQWPTPIPQMLVRGVENGSSADGKESGVSRSIEELPMPARDDLMQMVLRAPVNEARLSTSRGCNYQCSFCIDAIRYNRKWYARSAVQVVDEIERLNRCLGIQHFWMSDDNFLTNSRDSRRRAGDIANGLIERKLDVTYRARFRSDTFVDDPGLLTLLNKSGLISAFVGVEAGSAEQLERFNKNTTVEHHKVMANMLRKNGIALQIGFIMFEPYASFDDVLKSGQFLYEMDEMYVVSNFIQSLDLFPGAGIVDNMLDDGLIEPGFGAFSNYDAYNFREPRIGKLAKCLELCHDTDTITRDKWIYRYRTNLLPRLYRSLIARGAKEDAVEQWKERERFIIAGLNDLNHDFFKKAIMAAQQDTLEATFDSIKEETWKSQSELLARYTALYEDIKKAEAELSPKPVSSTSAGADMAGNDGSEETIGRLPEEVEDALAQALKSLPDRGPQKRELLGGGNLNYMIKITNNEGSFVFRYRRPEHTREIEDYLGRLYAGAVFWEETTFLRMRTIAEEVAFITRLREAKLPTVPLVAHGDRWMLLRFVEGRTLSAHLGSGASVAVVLRLLYQLRVAHEKGIIYGDRWGGNEIVDTGNRLCFLDFDVELPVNSENFEHWKNMEMGVALFGCLLATTQRDAFLGCMEHYGIPQLREWGYRPVAINKVLRGYRSFYLDKNKPVNPLSAPFETYKDMEVSLDKLTDLLEVKC